MVLLGINGFGRIGKSIFLQILNQKNLKVVAINIPNFDITNIKTYLNYDSCHQYPIIDDLEVIDHEYFTIKNEKIRVFNNRNAQEINWKEHNIDYVIDSTGAYLTTEKVKLHNVNYVIMCAPPKDNTPQFVVNGNHNTYQGEKYISNSSCTTNCIVPVLRFLEDHYQIKTANFTTIHATTASQTTIDTNHLDKRTHRSIYNNIIPHTTGASKAITKIIPSLEGKIFGTSLRVPVINVSLIDLNVKLEKKTNLAELLEHFRQCHFILVNDKKHLVSSDFNTTTCPSIIDSHACLQLYDNEFKLLVWYDNEWSYSSKVIELVSYVSNYNLKQKKQSHPLFIENLNYLNKRVVLRLDWNIPIHDGKIMDDFRINSSLKTINYLLTQDPKYLILVSHLGRPKNKEEHLSWKNYLKEIQKYFETPIVLLPDIISKTTHTLLSQEKNKLFLLENIRFFESETNYNSEIPSNEVTQYLQLGDVYVNDAFGCCHRDHMSITSFRYHQNKSFGYLINEELNNLNQITNNQTNQKILAIIGGGKMDDKLPLLRNLSKKIDTIYIAGGNINSIRNNYAYQEYLETIRHHKASIYTMKDGLAAVDLKTPPTMMKTDTIQNLISFYDIGMESIIELGKLILEHDIIFWNGPLGVIEHNLYYYGSKILIKLLSDSGKRIIIGGGDTAAFVHKYPHNFEYISTGGGASLDYISNGHLIGFDIFKCDKKN